MSMWLIQFILIGTVVGLCLALTTKNDIRELKKICLNLFRKRRK